MNENKHTEAKTLPRNSVGSGDWLGSVSGRIAQIAEDRYDDINVNARERIRCYLEKTLVLENARLRARLQAIAAEIEDSEYFGRVSPRGAPKMLTEIADSCHNTLECCNGIRRRALCENGYSLLPNTLLTPSAHDKAT